MTTPCVKCGGYVPLPQTKGEDTYCTGCGMAYRLWDVEEIWFNQFWEKYEPVEPKK